MASITNRERLVQRKVIDKCWKYLDDNFHKFNENQQIKIIIALCSKDVPQEITGDLKHTVTQMPTIEKGNRLLEYNIGTN